MHIGLLPPGVRLGSQDDRTLPSLYSMGFTNLVDRPSRSGAELSATEARAAAPTLMAKIKKYRPRFVCFVSKQAWDMFAGVGLGLQTAWVSWYDEMEDDALMGGGEEDSKAVIQHNLGAQGYRMSPYFEEGPGARKMEQDLAAEGVPSPFGSQEYRSGFVKREACTESFSDLHLKRDEEEDSNDVKMDVDVHDFKVKVEEETKVKVEETKVKVEGEINVKVEEDTKVKVEENTKVKVEEDTKIKVEEDIKVKVEQDTKVKVEDFASSSSSVKREDRSRGPPSWPKRGVVRGSRMFVMPSTSGRVTQYTKQDKLAYFKQLAELVRRDRQLRGL
jgi:G:T/U-mismatch repair DNA glycosylase